MRRLILACAGALLIAADQPPRPYLDDLPVVDLTRVLPTPPEQGSPRDADDRATFRQTRALAGTPRWAMATRDVSDDRFTVFACAIGHRLDARSAPALARLFVRMGDGGMVDHAKAHFAVRRPFLNQPGRICEARTASLAANGDYPSGHTASGWATALVLAELMPARATAILRRGRQFGESRLVCGVHSRSAVEAGYLAGATQVSLLHASAAFRHDMDDARAELARQDDRGFPARGNCELSNGDPSRRGGPARNDRARLRARREGGSPVHRRSRRSLSRVSREPATLARP